MEVFEVIRIHSQPVFSSFLSVIDSGQIGDTRYPGRQFGAEAKLRQALMNFDEHVLAKVFAVLPLRY